MTDWKIVKKWDNSKSSNSFSRCGMRAHIQVGDKHYILSEAWPMDIGYENMLFACNEDGVISSFTDLWVTTTMQFEEALVHLKVNLNEIEVEIV